MSPDRVLVVTTDLLPLPGWPTTGAGLRAWGLGEGLRAAGFQAAYAVPDVVMRGRTQPTGVELVRWEEGNQADVIERADPAVVVFCHWPSMALTARLRRPTVLDFHGPHLLERERQGRGTRADNIRAKLSAIRMADTFTCAGERQRRYFLSWLRLAGVENPEARLAVVPVAFDPRLPARQPPPEDPVLIFAGVFSPWQDPLPGLQATAEVLAEVGPGSLEIYGGAHPVHSTGEEPARRVRQALAGYSRVNFYPMIAHEDLLARYARATAMVEVMAPNLERELAFTTRTAESLWCGLPVIYQNYAELSAWIGEYQAGWSVDPNEPEAIRAAIRTALTDPADVARRSANAQRLASERLAWDRAVRPLAEFCRAPTFRPESPLPDMRPPPPPEKSLRQLMDEATYHYRTGGLGALRRNTLGFVRKQVRKRWAA